MIKKRGHIFVVSAPSGTGKTSLCKEILKTLPDVSFSISYTTRPPRPTEVNGVHYIFVSTQEFKNIISKGALVEWTDIHGHLYGTSIESLNLYANQGRDVLFDLDVKGAAEIKKRYPQAVTIFILPPSMEQLRQRLSRRETEDPQALEERLKYAEKEIAHAKEYDYTVVNDQLDRAVGRIKDIIIAKRCEQNH